MAKVTTKKVEQEIKSLVKHVEKVHSLVKSLGKESPIEAMFSIFAAHTGEHAKVVASTSAQFCSSSFSKAVIASLIEHQLEQGAKRGTLSPMEEAIYAMSKTLQKKSVGKK